MTNKNHPTLNYRGDIDGLRAVAILAVIIFHAFPKALPGGFVGVDIFFVISGYLISSIIFKNLENQKFSFLNFYFHRVRRIFPALILVMLFSITASWFFLFPQEFVDFAKLTLSGIGFVINFELLQEAGYFDVAAETKPLLHLWSLSIEEQFYILAPVLFLFCWKKKYKILPALLFIFTISIISSVIIVQKHPSAAFYLPICRFFEIALGAILSQLELDKKFTNFSKNHSNLFSVLGLAFIILSIAFINKNQKFPGYLALFPCLGAALLIAAGQTPLINRKILANKFSIAIGLISYPLYLWHWPLLSFATIIKGRSPRPELALGMVALSFLLAFLTYKFLEKPIRNRFKLNKDIFVLSSPALVIAALSLIIIFFNGFENRLEAKKNLLIRTSKRSRLTDEPCLNLYHKKIGNNYCRIFGNGSKKVFIIGDSQSQAIFSGYRAQFVDNDYQVIHLANSGCPFITNDEKLDQKLTAADQSIKDCNIMFKKIIDEAITQKASAILFANNAWYDRHGDFTLGMQTTLDLIPATIPVIYFLQNPIAPFAPLSCIKDEKADFMQSCSFKRHEHDKNTEEYLEEITKLKSHYQNLKTIDPTEALCDKEKCYIFDGEGLLYSNNSHLSKYGGSVIAKKLPIKF